MTGPASGVVLLQVTVRVPCTVGTVANLARRLGVTWSEAFAMVAAEIEGRCCDGPQWLPSVLGHRVTATSSIVVGPPL